jgi:hypothetical protein
MQRILAERLIARVLDALTRTRAATLADARARLAVNARPRL